jgi:hypothetical protein
MLWSISVEFEYKAELCNLHRVFRVVMYNPVHHIHACRAIHLPQDALAPTLLYADLPSINLLKRGLLTRIDLLLGTKGCIMMASLTSPSRPACPLSCA